MSEKYHKEAEEVIRRHVVRPFERMGFSPEEIRGVRQPIDQAFQSGEMRAVEAAVSRALNVMRTSEPREHAEKMGPDFEDLQALAVSVPLRLRIILERGAARTDATAAAPSWGKRLMRLIG